MQHDTYRMATMSGFQWILESLFSLPVGAWYCHQFRMADQNRMHVANLAQGGARTPNVVTASPDSLFGYW